MTNITNNTSITNNIALNNSNKPKKKRINKYDNMKGIAIFLVVLFHILGTHIPKFPYYDQFYYFLYLFHMPIFFFVGGYLINFTKDSPIKAFKSLMIPYFVFSVIWYILEVLFYNFSISDIINSIPFINPPYGLWFLFSLFIMRLILPILKKIKNILWISILVALFVGFMPLPLPAFLSRTFCFIPIFIVGFRYQTYKSRFITFLNNLSENKYLNSVYNFLIKWKKEILIILFIILLIFAWEFTGIVPNKATMMNKGYFKFNITLIEGVIMRLITIALGIFASILLNELISNTKSFITKLGVYSLSIYLLHFLFIRATVKIVKMLKIKTIIHGNIIFSILFIAILLGVIIFVLSRDSVNKYFTKFLDLWRNLILSN
ncbi:MAG: acyltransferase family protein [Methanobrevibacter sp.]|jgi:fucose 4-O-acetylase-like acetyltransferase|nr:acyltransferase family protein [Candidatus Methanoflexus mossambicus]